MTFAELCQAIGAWLNDPQVEPSIPTFITLAEARLPSATVRASCLVDAEYSQAPDDLARPLSLVLASGEVIDKVSAESLLALKAADAAGAGKPRRYALVGGAFRFHPAPDKAYAVELCYQARLSPESKIAGIYGDTEISERHRHRYEVNIDYKERLEECGLVFAGMSPDGVLPETVEYPDHPWFIGVQYHPELKSRPLDPHPLFASFIGAAVEQSRLV